MINQINTYFRIPLAVGIFCAAMVLPAAAQDFYGQREHISPSERVRLQQFSNLPVRILLTDARYSESTLSYQNMGGDLRSYQHPETAQNFSLTSYGITSFKSIRLEGRFQYRKELQNDVGWKLVRDAYHQPYYYGNIRPGDWDNDRYDLQLNGGTTFLDDRLLLGLGVDYNVEQLARYNDPRPSISYYHLFLKTQLGWRMGNHSLSLYYGSGYSDEKGRVTNYFEANDSFGQREYNIITVTGIGSYSLRRRNSYEKPKDRTEYGATYQYKSNSFEMTTEAIIGKSETKFSRRGSVNGTFIENTLGRYFEDFINGKLFLTLPFTNHTFQFSSNTHWSDGYDENTNFAGANYFHQNFRQELRFFYYNADQSLALQTGINFNDQSFTDRNASHDYNYQRISSDISLQYATTIGARTISFIPGVSYSFASSNSITVPPSSRNLLTKYLVSPDYYLNTSDIVGFHGGVQIKQNFKNLEVGLLFDYKRQMLINEGIVFGEPDFYPSDARNMLSVTLQFFH